MVATAQPPLRVLGRYVLYDAIASGGMATVHFGRLLGPVGFARTVAIKRLHPQYARDPEFVAMFLDEARLAARIGHPNVVSTLDVVATDGELFLVMEYVQGESLGGLLKLLRQAGQPIRIPYAVAIMAGALRGLHAAHEATNEQGRPLGIVHRDISPQNILVGVDGVPRVLDFGVAKAAGRLQSTRDGQLKGKMSYMSPEQIRSLETDRRTDVYAAGAVLWEALAGRKLFTAESDVAMFGKVLEANIEPPSALNPLVPPELDGIVMRALAADAQARFPTAREMAKALDQAVPLVAPAEIGEWVESTGADHLARRAQTVSRIEADSSANLQGPLLADAASLEMHTSSPSAVGDRTEVSGASAMRAAVVPAVGRTKTFVAAGGGAAALLALGALVAVLAMRQGPQPPAPTTGAAPSATTPTAVAPPPPASVERVSPATAAPTQSSTAAASAAPPAPSQSAAPVAAPRPQPRAHPLESVLDSRK
jgi:serine/threonine-protein kinase